MQLQVIQSHVQLKNYICETFVFYVLVKLNDVSLCFDIFMLVFYTIAKSVVVYPKYKFVLRLKKWREMCINKKKTKNKPTTVLNNSDDCVVVCYCRLPMFCICFLNRTHSGTPYSHRDDWWGSEHLCLWKNIRNIEWENRISFGTSSLMLILGLCYVQVAYENVVFWNYKW